MTLSASQSIVTHTFYINHLYVETTLRFNKILGRFNTCKVEVLELGQPVEVLFFHVWMMGDGITL